MCNAVVACRLAMLPGSQVSRSLAEYSRSGEVLLLAGLYGQDNVVELWRLHPSPTRIMMAKAGPLSGCRLLDDRGTLVLAVATDRFPDSNGYKVLTDSGTVIGARVMQALSAYAAVSRAGAGTAADAAAAAGTGASADAQAGATTREDAERRLRAASKKLRQLEPLKERLRLGQQLEQNQLTKLAGEAALQAEVADLTAALAQLSGS